MVWPGMRFDSSVIVGKQAPSGAVSAKSIPLPHKRARQAGRYEPPEPRDSRCCLLWRQICSIEGTASIYSGAETSELEILE